MPTKRGWLAVGQAQAPLDFTTAAVDDAGNILPLAQDDLQAKHPDGLNNRPAALLVIEVDGQGKLLSRRLLSSGLSLYPAGMVQAGADAVVFGSSGFNPGWSASVLSAFAPAVPSSWPCRRRSW